ncbi:MAG: hypothetical protein BWX83_01153 [Candidatus Cloacimonetes bacterium ADurb.Bin117]|nr:MAG: hypothetical protein BWX83_01153 [Candidatus Cloacimonetes bacterium ADurb.Bin117]
MVAVGGVDHQQIHTLFRKFLCPFQIIAGDSDRGSDQQAVLIVLYGVWVAYPLQDVPHREHAGQAKIGGHDQEFFDPVFLQEGHAILVGSAFRSGYQSFTRRHQVFHKPFAVGLKTNVPAGQDAHQLSLFHHRKSADPVVFTDLVHSLQGVVRSKGVGAGDESAFSAFHPSHFIRLLFNAEVFMDDSQATFPRHRDRHSGFCNRIHGRAQNRDFQA